MSDADDRLRELANEAAGPRCREPEVWDAYHEAAHPIAILDLLNERDRLMSDRDAKTKRMWELGHECDALRAKLAEAEKLTAEQAEDSGLWFAALTAPEAYLQNALRYLHAVIEGDAAIAAQEKP